MSRTDPFLEAMRLDRDALADAAPSPDWPRLMRTVRQRQEAKLEARLRWLGAVAPALLLGAGAAPLLTAGTWHLAVPCWGVAFWLALNGPGLPVASPLALRT